MKKVCLIAMTLCMVLFGALATGCGGVSSSDVDIDITAMSANARNNVISAIANQNTRMHYVGRSIRIDGETRLQGTLQWLTFNDECCATLQIRLFYEGDFPPTGTHVVAVGVWTREGTVFFLSVTQLTILES